MRKVVYWVVNNLTKIAFPVAVWWWKFTKPKTFGVKVVIENSLGQILLIKVTYISKTGWVFPGGKIERGEALIEAAKREVKEEVGLKLNSLTEVGKYFSNKWGKQDTVTVFTGQVQDPSVKIQELEIKEARWFTLDKLPTLPENNAKAFALYSQYKHGKN